MIRLFFPCYAFFGFLTLVACSPDQANEVLTHEFRSVDTTVLSRGVAVPVTLTAPLVDEGVSFPLVVLAHGHGGSREEGGGYVQLAQKLAELGIASIRMDFPGCGDSTESFTENNLSNMLADLQASRSFAEAQTGVDSNRIGLLGFSNGGRLAALLAEIDPDYKAMVLWAPTVADGVTRKRVSLGGVDKYNAMKKKAQETGGAEYTTSFGQKLVLGYRYFTDYEASYPLASLGKYEGRLLVLYGDQDDVVPPAISEAAISAATNSIEVVRHVLPGVGHDLGIYSNLEEVAAEVINTSAEFLQQRL